MPPGPSRAEQESALLRIYWVRRHLCRCQFLLSFWKQFGNFNRVRANTFGITIIRLIKGAACLLVRYPHFLLLGVTSDDQHNNNFLITHKQFYTALLANVE